MFRSGSFALLLATLAVPLADAQPGPFVTVDVEDHPVASVLQDLSEAGLSLQFDADALADRTVTIQLQDVLAVSVLKLVCQAAACGLEQADDGRWIVTPSRWGSSPADAARERMAAYDLEGALGILGGALAETPGDLETLSLAVQLSCRARKLTEARGFLSRLEQLETQAPQDRAVVELARAHVHEADGLKPPAIEAYTAALQEDPDCLAACLGRAKLLQEIGDHDAAAADWRAYLERDGDSPTAEAVRLGCIAVCDERVKSNGLSPTWSPDGTRIANVVRATDGGGYGMRLRDVRSGDETVLIPPRPEFMWSADWSPDGRLIAYEYRDRGNTEGAPEKGIEVVDVETGDIQRFEEPVDTYYPRWHPDGLEILTYVDQPYYALRTLPFDLDKPRLQFQPLLGYTYCYADWSPDGRHIVASWSRVTGQEYALYLVDAEDPIVEHEPLTPHDQASRIRAAYSPDGRLIAYLRTFEPYQYALYIMAADGTGRELQVTTPPQTRGDRLMGFCWAPDGRHIAYSTYGYELHIVTLGGLRQTPP